MVPLGRGPTSAPNSPKETQIAVYYLLSLLIWRYSSSSLSLPLLTRLPSLSPTSISQYKLPVLCVVHASNAPSHCSLCCLPGSQSHYLQHVVLFNFLTGYLLSGLFMCLFQWCKNELSTRQGQVDDAIYICIWHIYNVFYQLLRYH